MTVGKFGDNVTELEMFLDHLMADRGACVSDCGSDHISDADGKCVSCGGPCPKSELISIPVSEAHIQFYKLVRLVITLLLLSLL